MGEDSKSGWDRLFEELKDPWDWTAATVGGAAGAVSSFFLHGFDLGHSIPTAALGADGARRAVVAGFRRRTLGNKARRLLNLLDEERNYPDLAVELRDILKKWNAKVITDGDKFNEKIDQICDEDSNRKRKQAKEFDDE